jgi:hypothetical protein
MTGNCDGKIFAEKFGSLAEVSASLQQQKAPEQNNAPAPKRQAL